jgi:hypothetical protein
MVKPGGHLRMGLGAEMQPGLLVISGAKGPVAINATKKAFCGPNGREKDDNVHHLPSSVDYLPSITLNVFTGHECLLEKTVVILETIRDFMLQHYKS